MIDQDCERYLEDPDANAGHLAGCKTCSALFHELDSPLEVAPVVIESLPLAPWEGATHRAWTFVVAGAVTLCAVVVSLFWMAGVPLLKGIAVAFRVPSPRHLAELAANVGTALAHAPGSFRLAVLAGFVVVNVLLLALLRRSPRGGIGAS